MKPIKKMILKLVQQIIYKYSERTPPNIKHSKRNYVVSKIALSINELIELC